MSDPTRIRDGGGPSSEIRALFADARRSRPMDAAVRARAEARIARLAVLPAAAGVVLWWKGVALAAGLGTLGVLTVWEVVPLLVPPPVKPPVSSAVERPAEAVASPALPRATPPAPPKPAAPPEPAASTLGLAPAPARPRAPPAASAAPPAPSSRDDALAREATLLESARASLDRDPDGSLATLDRYRAEFPLGNLRMEAELLAVDALGRAGRTADARARGEALLEQVRGSIYEERAQKLLERLDAP
jgi:hypothetical protein